MQKAIRTGVGAQNMAIMRHAALNILNKRYENKNKKNKINSMSWSKNILRKKLKAQ